MIITIQNKAKSRTIINSGKFLPDFAVSLPDFARLDAGDIVVTKGFCQNSQTISIKLYKNKK